ncbi:MAG TPA: peptide-N4-asparagine amidase [Rhodanobacteraceae bacterium]
MSHRQPESMLRRSLLLGLALLASCAAWAGTGAAQVDAGNVATARPDVPRPGVKPCIVTLIPREDFGSKGNNTRMDAVPHAFHYAPPAGCRGPWAKVVLEADFSVDRGIQFDRTASIWLDGVNLYFGTTQEPSPKVAPHWRVQRDLTDYASVLRHAGSGRVIINNWLSGVRLSIIHASARLLFYPANARYPAPKVPSRVYALNGGDALPAQLKTGDQWLSRTLRFPRNTARVYMDVFAQAQSTDEEYYTCLEQRFMHKPGKPDAHAVEQRFWMCPGGSFREAEVAIDGTPAGLAPIAPWIFTGGIDPYLWRPTPANETLDFIPYRVNLTPFAGVLSDGKPHAVAVRVLDAHDYFAVAAALLVYQAADSAHTGGAVTVNTLKNRAIKPRITSTLGDIKGARSGGDVTTQSRENYVIEGYIDTPKGRVTTRVDDTLGFHNEQQFLTRANGDRRHLTQQHARMHSIAMRRGGGIAAQQVTRNVDYRLDFTAARPASNNASLHQLTVTLHQRFGRDLRAGRAGVPTYQAHVRTTHVGADHMLLDPSRRQSLRHTGQTSLQNVVFWNSLGDCYQASVQARNSKVVQMTHGLGCLDGKSSVHWFVHPDGSPDSLGWQDADND